MPEAQCIEKCKTGNKSDCSTENISFVFQPITLESKALLENYMKPWKAECSDLSFPNLFIWGTDNKMQYAEKDDCLFIKLNFPSVPVFFWAPIPKFGVKVDYRKAVYDAISYMESVGAEPTFRSVCQPFMEMMQATCPELLSTPTDIAWDYVYEREKLATLKGKKLHGKRNHINKFLSLYPNFVYKKLDSSMIPACIALYDQWSDEKEEPSIELGEERKSVLLALNHMNELGLVGGTIFIDEKLVAFTVGERLLEYMDLVHIEKADAAYEGLYPMINQQYILHECMDVDLVNREEDMGIAGMRKAKRAYHPVKMIEKHLFSTRNLADVKGIWGEEGEE